MKQLLFSLISFLALSVSAQVDIDIQLDGDAAHFINGLGVSAAVSGSGMGDVTAGNTLTNATPLVGAGGTTIYATNTSGYRSAIGLAIGNDVEAYDLDLLRIAAISSASGDILYRDATGWTNLAKATDTQLLTLTSGFPAWANPVTNNWILSGTTNSSLPGISYQDTAQITNYVSAGTTNRWKTGDFKTGVGLVLITTNYIEITVNGTTYKLGLVQ